MNPAELFDWVIWQDAGVAEGRAKIAPFTADCGNTGDSTDRLRFRSLYPAWIEECETASGQASQP
jgi:hypothetical protein